MSLRRSVLALLSSASLAASAAAAPPAVPTLGVDALQRGQTAIVHTVFEGARVETFEAEILGVLRGGRAEGDLIIARATSERVVRTGVAAGMSGSPVYVDGRLIGALSSGWPFVREPLFGITPIDEMLSVLDLPERPPGPGTTGPAGVDLPGGPQGLAYGAFRWTEEPPEARPVAPGRERGGPTALPLPLVCVGVHGAAMDEVARTFAPFGLAAVPGSRAADGGPGAASLAPGSAVAVDLMRGDVQLAAIGTLTYRDGDRVLIFGHPFFQAGDVRMPLSSAEIVTIVPSAQSPFKLGSRGREVGTVTQDRRPAVAGRLGPAPRLLPLAVHVRGVAAGAQVFRFEMIEDRQLAGTLVSVAVSNSLLESGGTSAAQTARWTLTLHRRGTAPLVLRDVTSGESPLSEVAGGVASPLRFLYNNPFDRLSLDSLRVDVEVTPGRDQWSLRSARVLEATVRPGGTARVVCELERWRGERERREVRVAVPRELPDGRYLLWVGGGPELSRYEAQRLPGRYRPSSLEDAWRRLAANRPSDALYAALVARAPEVTSEGRDYPELPLSALAMMSAGQSASDGPRPGDLVLLEETRTAFQAVVRGELLLSLQVDSRAP
jgi:hypothetical protein